jgi:hypothetical protein
MKSIIRRLLIIIIAVLTALPIVAMAERKVFGVLVDKAKNPVAGARIKLWDSDVGHDNKMGETITKEDGSYIIKYSPGSYDGPKTRFHTNWRPDIYVTAEIQDEQDSPWYKAARSKVFKNHKLKDDLRVNLVTFTMDLPAGCRAEYEMEVWQGDAGKNGIPWDHSATRTRIYQTCGGNRSLITTVDKCNKGKLLGIARGGRCPGEEGLKIIWKYNSPARKGNIVFPVGCNAFGYHKYGLIGDEHVCNNDSFMQMGIVVSGKIPHNKIVEKICENRNYTNSTGRDPKYAPSFENVIKFISKYGWDRPQGGGGGGGGGHDPRPQK